MRFLVTTKYSHPVPADQFPILQPAMQEWADTYRKSGQVEQIWAFAGINGGGAILNVDSLEELSDIMAVFPMGDWTDIQVYGLSDFDHMLGTGRRMLEEMQAR